MPTKQQGSCAATPAAPEMLVLNLSTQSGLNLTRHGSEQPATADVEEDEEDPMDYMMGLDLAVNGHGFEATIGRIEFSRLLFNQNKW